MMSNDTYSSDPSPAENASRPVVGPGSEPKTTEPTPASIDIEPSPPASLPPLKKKTWIPEVPRFTVLIVILLVLLFDYVLYQGDGPTGGLGLAALLLATAGILCLIKRPTFSPEQITCIGLLMIFALRTASQVTFFAKFICFVLIFIFACSLYKFSLHIPELLHSFARTVFWLPLTLIGIFRNLFRLSFKLPHWTLLGFRVGLAWVIPAVVVLVFLFIFGMGNLVVGSWMESAWQFIWEQLLRLPDYFPSIGHVFFWIFSLTLIVIFLIPQPVKITLLTPFLGKAEKMKPGSSLPLVDFQAKVALNTLIAVNVLFLLYNGVDTFYLWIHKTLPAGINYSSYARSGTFWLTVALALTSLVLGIIFLRGLNFHKRTPILKVFSWIWVAQNLILAMGTFRRLQMYIDYNGLTRTRIVGAYGILVVIAGLLIVAFKMRDAKSFLWMVRRHALAFVLTLFALAMTPMDFFVFRYNTRIILSGNPRSAVQMVVQPITAEGIPSLIPLLNSPNKEIREGVAGILLREKHRLLQQQRQGKRWVDGELASSRALRMIAAVQHRLDEIIPDGQWPGPVDKLYKNTRQWYD